MRSIVRSEEILRDAQEEASAIRAKAEKDAIWEKKIAMLNAKNEISSIAVEIAEKVIARELNESDQAALVNQFIDQLGGEQ